MNVLAKTRTPIYYSLRPYATAGVGTFRIHEGITTRTDRSEFATNLGAGVTYDFNRWLGASFDYRRFFVDFGDKPGQGSLHVRTEYRSALKGNAW